MTIKRFLSLACGLLLVCQLANAAESLNDKLGRFFGNISNSVSEEEEFLDPDDAFILTADVIDPHHLQLQWEIADGYYLYRNRFAFTADNQNFSITEQPAFPPGKIKEDPEFGKVEVYFKNVSILVPLTRQVLDEKTVNLSVTYQGCKDGEICYPPINKSVPLTLPVATSSVSETPVKIAETSTPKLSRQDAISISLQNKNVLINIVVFFGFGLLLAFTPCIFPMIPILSGIIIGQGKSITSYNAFILSLAYVIAMALSYAVLGIIAGSFQFNLQAASQNTWVLSLFSLVFVFLALSMFGLYELQLPISWQQRMTALSNRQKHGSIIGSAIMGMLSAVIVGPCVAPPLAGALIYISQTGNALLGGAALFALGMGIGLPLIIIGTSAGKLLPRAGAWMVVIKQIFGVIMLGVAIWLMSRVLPGTLTLLLWGVLLIVISIYMGVFDKPQNNYVTWIKLWKGLGIVFLVYGVMLIVGAASGSNDIFKPLQGLGYQVSSINRLKFRPVENIHELDRLLVEASRRHQVVMLDFYADWCITCKEMERFTFSDPTVHAALEKVVLLQADVTENNAVDQELMHRFNIIGPPAILFFVDGQEQRNHRLVGFVDAEDFINHIKSINSL